MRVLASRFYPQVFSSCAPYSDLALHAISCLSHHLSSIFITKLQLKVIDGEDF